MSGVEMEVTTQLHTTGHDRALYEVFLVEVPAVACDSARRRVTPGNCMTKCW